MRTRRCPRCWSDQLLPVVAAGTANLLCTACHRCWHLELGHLIEVNRHACPGCADRSICHAR